MIIRPANLTDMTTIQQIYAHYVANTTISFEYEPPSIDEMSQRLTHIQAQHFPYIVSVNEDHQVIGFAYATPYSDRLAYQYACILSVYIDHQHTNQGIGKTLYQELERLLTEQGIVQMVAIITKNNAKSIQFHEQLGFSIIGTFPNAGYKFKQWLDIVWMVKTINPHKLEKEWKHETP